RSVETKPRQDIIATLGDQPINQSLKFILITATEAACFRWKIVTDFLYEIGYRIAHGMLAKPCFAHELSKLEKWIGVVHSGSIQTRRSRLNLELFDPRA